MEKNEKRFLIIGIIIAIILFLILVVFGIIFYLGIIDNNKKEDIGIVIEVYKYMMENYIIDKGYNKYLNITNYDELLYNELKESSTSQGICRINKNYGICSALSTIFKELLSTFNIENEIIYGYITDKEEKFRHQWNSVKICNNLYIIDILIVIM